MSLFRCPLCAAPLQATPQTYLCPNGHSYDRSKEGYVHLLPVNQMHSRLPGDDKAMVAARNRFLSRGYYEPLRQALCAQVLHALRSQPNPALLDSGCGEGFYTAGLAQALAVNGSPHLAGIDLSKFALRWAAKRAPSVEFAVASAYHLPLADHSVHLVLNCFSPLALDEVRRVLKPNGVFLYVVPAAEHLWELKQVLYAQPYQNPQEDSHYDGFQTLDVLPVKARLQIDTQADLMDLFQMTPYYWKTPRDGSARLAALPQLDVSASFRIHLFQAL